jgi:hypothetical protein
VLVQGLVGLATLAAEQALAPHAVKLGGKYGPIAKLGGKNGKNGGKNGAMKYGGKKGGKKGGDRKRVV